MNANRSLSIYTVVLSGTPLTGALIKPVIGELAPADSRPLETPVDLASRAICTSLTTV